VKHDEDYFYGYSASDLRVAQYLVDERQRQLAAQAPNMGRRQAAFARASEALADRQFPSQAERVQAEVFLAGFFLGEAA
jgi:multidrug efflux pump subunit AcrA (membrane-fusion protein)